MSKILRKQPLFTGIHTTALGGKVSWLERDVGGERDLFEGLGDDVARRVHASKGIDVIMTSTRGRKFQHSISLGYLRTG